MKKTLIALLALAGCAIGNEATWNGTTGLFNTPENWSTESTPASGDTIIINNGSTVSMGGYDPQSGQSLKMDNLTIKVSNSSALDLTTKWSGSRFDAAYEIDTTSSVTVQKSFMGANNTILGTLYITEEVSPGDNKGAGVAINFGKTGSIQFKDGSNNRMEGNDRTITFGATLDNTAYQAGLTTALYTVETRYLIKGDSGNDFNPGQYGTLTLSGGTILGADGTPLVNALTENPVLSSTAKYTTDTLTASADDFGKYLLGCDTHGIYVQFVKATTPEPATATLSLLALAGLAARRRRH